MFDSPVAFTNQIRFFDIIGEIENYNVFEILGNPTYPLNLFIRISSNAVIQSFTTGDVNSLSNIRILNQGYILGVGGNGGAGAILEGDFDGGVFTPAEDGTAGEPALTTNCTLEVDSSSGYIWGGGGGGGGNADLVSSSSTMSVGGGGSGGVSGGFAGVGIPFGEPATSGINAVPGNVNSSGGNWGSSGMPGNSSSSAGGAAGKAIELNGNNITFINSGLVQLQNEGRILGGVS